ncbi:MAG: hypothetical protein ACJ71P_15165 [Nitrososphaeraceae archaeon]
MFIGDAVTIKEEETLNSLIAPFVGWREYFYLAQRLVDDMMFFKVM